MFDWILWGMGGGGGGGAKSSTNHCGFDECLTKKNFQLKLFKNSHNT